MEQKIDLYQITVIMSAEFSEFKFDRYFLFNFPCIYLNCLGQSVKKKWHTK